LRNIFPKRAFGLAVTSGEASERIVVPLVVSDSAAVGIRTPVPTAGVSYEIPEQKLDIDLARMPALPRSGLALSDVRRLA